MGNKKIVISVLIALIGLAILFGCTSSSGSKVTPTSTDTNVVSNQASGTATTENIENGVVGTPYQITYMSDTYQVTMLEVAFEPATYYTGYQYLLANIELKNIGSEKNTFNPDIYFVDANGEKYDTTGIFGINDKYSKTWMYYTTLEPNTKVTGWVGFKIPASLNSGNLFFQYTTNLFDKSSNYIKFVIQK
ncbi:MAG: DUF4352 domain-containing protein [archaeon]|jgi:hypothetical protein